MKLTLILSLLALYANSAHAYSSGPAGDPNLGFRDVETASVVKVDSTAGYDDAISKGMGVFYEDGAGGLTGLYKVSVNYSGTYNTALASKVTACIAQRAVATGDLAAFPCVSKGYVDYALYSAGVSIPIVQGAYLCVSNLATSKGRLVGCASSVTSPFIALESKAEQTTGTIKVRVVSP